MHSQSYNNSCINRVLLKFWNTFLVVIFTFPMGSAFFYCPRRMVHINALRISTCIGTIDIGSEILTGNVSRNRFTYHHQSVNNINAGITNG